MPRSRSPRALVPALWPGLLVSGVVGVDRLIAARSWPLVAFGLLDEIGHLLTAVLVLAAVLPRRRRLWRWALLGAVAIDLDHVPLYWWGALSTLPGHRPLTHSLLTVAELLGAAEALPRLRVLLRGLGIGVLLHLVRDVATVPGLPLAWPVSLASFQLPYWLYVVVLIALAVTAAARPSRPARPLATAGGAPVQGTDPGRTGGMRLAAWFRVNSSVTTPPTARRS